METPRRRALGKGLEELFSTEVLDFDQLEEKIVEETPKEEIIDVKISDLKESGELEQSATTVIMLHDENVYRNSGDRKHDIQLIIGKNRNGLTGKIQFDYIKSTQRFNEYKKEDNNGL